MKEELLKGLSEEQIAKIKACQNNEEILALAKQEGFELTDEQLAAVSGGCGSSEAFPACPQCGSDNITRRTFGGYYYYTCFNCCPDYIWKEPERR